MSARVIHVESDSDDPRWQVTVVREEGGIIWAGDPDPSDVPDDIRKALSDWLRLGAGRATP